jgi:hypothetical protein
MRIYKDELSRTVSLLAYTMASLKLKEIVSGASCTDNQFYLPLSSPKI